MKAKKTVTVQFLKDLINDRNKLSTCSRETRIGWNSVLEEALLHTHNYQGYTYLTATEVPSGELPGKVWDDVIYTFPDDSRRYYY